MGTDVQIPISQFHPNGAGDTFSGEQFREHFREPREPIGSPEPRGSILEGELTLLPGARTLVLFAHGSGSSRLSPRNLFVAELLHRAGLATLLFDLLSPEEDAIDQITAEYRFDIPLLADRLLQATRWVDAEVGDSMALGYFGASTGGAAALMAAAERPERISAVVSRGGRPDLAGRVLADVRAPTLLLVGELDHLVLELNRIAQAKMVCEVKLEVIAGAQHLFEEPGALEEVANRAADWMLQHEMARTAADGL